MADSSTLSGAGSEIDPSSDPHKINVRAREAQQAALEAKEATKAALMAALLSGDSRYPPGVKTLATNPNPSPLPEVGRDLEDFSAIERRLFVPSTNRVFSIAGAGGSGKTNGARSDENGRIGWHFGLVRTAADGGGGSRRADGGVLVKSIDDGVAQALSARGARGGALGLRPTRPEIGGDTEDFLVIEERLFGERAFLHRHSAAATSLDRLVKARARTSKLDLSYIMQTLAAGQSMYVPNVTFLIILYGDKKTLHRQNSKEGRGRISAAGPSEVLQ